MIKELAKKVLSPAMGLSGVMKLKYTSNHILGFHRIINEDEKSNFDLANFEVTIQRFKELIEFYQSQGFEIVTLDKFITNNMDRQKKVVFTFDDGYEDIQSKILPVIKEYKIPITIFCVQNYLNRTLIKWDYILDRIVAESNDLNQLLSHCEIIPTVPKSNLQKINVYKLIKDKFKLLNNNKNFHIIEDFCLKFGENKVSSVNNLLLNEEQLKSLSKESLVTIGSHSSNHYVMTEINDEEVNKELINSRLYLENLCQREIKHFCFPYGACGQREINATEATCYASSLTTQGRNLYKNKLESTFKLPRYVVRYGDAKKTFKYFMNGFGGF